MIERALLDLLATLDEPQRQEICFPFEAPERFDWHYIPKERAGLALKEMSETSRKAAMSLLQAALSEKGYARSRAIMQLEELVAEIEEDHATYHPLNYVLAVFGLTEEFIATMRQDIADRERRRLREAGTEKLHFAWAGELEPRRPHYWRLHGPTMVLEYDNTQNEANHIHSVWHDPTREFGKDLLARHYETGHFRPSA